MKGASSRGSAGNANMRQTGRAQPSKNMRQMKNAQLAPKAKRAVQSWLSQGQGPNRASGHKGGMGRQGSKRP